MEYLNDTMDTLLARYVAGTLPLPAHVMVGAHLEIKDQNRVFVRDLEAAAARELETTAPVALSDPGSMLERIMASEIEVGSPERSEKRVMPVENDVFPTALRDFIGFDSITIPWRTKMPGFKEFSVGEIDGCDVSMFWIRAGRALPEHTHEGSELTLVLDGGFSDGIGHYDRGDISIADESVDHRPVADDDGPCIGFAITTAPLKLTGSIGQLFSDIFGRSGR